MWEGQADVRSRRQTAIFTHNFFSWPYYAMLSSRAHLALLLLGRAVVKRKSAMGPRPNQGAQPLASAVIDCISSDCKWDWLKTHSVSHVGIFIYHFIIPPHFRSTTWLLPLIFTGASCEENLWLTVRSRVNMQQMVKNKCQRLIAKELGILRNSISEILFKFQNASKVSNRSRFDCSLELLHVVVRILIKTAKPQPKRTARHFVDEYILSN